MATAFCGSAQRAAPRQLLGGTKPKGVAGTVAATKNGVDKAGTTVAFLDEKLRFPNVRRGGARGSLPNRARTSTLDDADGQFQARHLSAMCMCYLLLAIREASTRRRVHMARGGRTARMDRIHSDRRLCENRHAYDALFGCRFPLSDATVFGNRGLSSYQSWNR
jgi:hypothetical protein